jgi:Sec-independent protein translocase protein TatA
MAGIGGELILLCGLGYVLLGPKRMHAILQHIARAKLEFDKTRRSLESQLTTGF